MAQPTYRVDTYAHPNEFPQDVLDLFQAAECSDIEFGATWYANLIDTVFSDRNRVRLYVLRKDGRPVICLPLLVIPKSLGEELHSLSNFYTSLYSPATALGVEVADFSALLKRIQALHPALYAFRFEPLDEASANLHMLKSALTDRHFACFDYFRFFNWQEQVDGDWDKYLARRAGQVRSTLKRKLSKLSADGGSLEIVRSGPELELAIKDYESVYSESWKRPEPYIEFIPGMLRAAAARGWLRMGIARLHGQAIAAQIWFIHHGRASIFKLAYRETHKVYSAGSLLTAHLMRNVLENDNVTTVDYLIGDDAYKREWMSTKRSRVGLLAFSKRHPLGLLFAVHELLATWSYPLRIRVKKLRAASALK